MLASHEASSGRFPKRLIVRAPVGLHAAIAAAARLNLTSSAEWTRRAILHALRAEGVRLTPDGVVETTDTERGEQP
jgi:hypothetical protein